MSRWIKEISFVIGCILFIVLVFGVYALPTLPKSWINTGDPDTIANQIAGMSYLLTFIATIFLSSCDLILNIYPDSGKSTLLIFDSKLLPPKE